MNYKALSKPKIDDMIMALQALRAEYGNLPLVGEGEGQDTFRLHPLKEDATSAYKPEDAVEIFVQIY